jgi:hypothetical protein
MNMSSLVATLVILSLQAGFALSQIRFARAMDRLLGPGRASTSPGGDKAESPA